MKAVGFDGGGVDLVAFRRIGMEGGELLRKIAQQLFFVDVRIWAAWERFYWNAANLRFSPLGRNNSVEPLIDANRH